MNEVARQAALDEIRRIYADRLRRRDELDTRDPNRLAHTDRIKWSAYGRMLERNRQVPLGKRDVLDVGCQWGTWLALCREQWGQEGGQLCGIELMEPWAERGRRLYPFIDLHSGSGDQLPWPDASFDLVHQGMVFSSVRNAELRDAIAAEIRRVVRPGGYVLWYDFFFNPTNRNTVGMTLPRVRSYFPEWRIVDRARVTLAPPVSRMLERISGGAVEVLTAMKVLNFHHLILLQKLRSD